MKENKYERLNCCCYKETSELGILLVQQARQGKDNSNLRWQRQSNTARTIRSVMKKGFHRVNHVMHICQCTYCNTVRKVKDEGWLGLK